MKSGALLTALPRLSFFALASLLAIFSGSVAIWHSGGGGVMALGNLAGWGIGLVAAASILAIPKAPKAAELCLAAVVIALVVATFADNGLSGVHRWISIGSFRVNIAALLLPAFVAILSTGKASPLSAALAWLATMSLLVAQPDASQATALAISCPLVFAKWQSKWRWPLLVATVVLAAISWCRPDPLQPVAEVEGIITLVWQISPALAAAGLAALAATIIAVRKAHASAAALAAYLGVVAVMPAIGHFPVPLAGAGISFPLGWWLGIAILLRSRQDGQARG